MDHKVYRNTVIGILWGKAGVQGCSFVRGNWLLKRSQDEMQASSGSNCLVVFDGQVKWAKEIQKSIYCPPKTFFFFESLSSFHKILDSDFSMSRITT